jgi:hypothetical protein
VLGEIQKRRRLSGVIGDVEWVLLPVFAGDEVIQCALLWMLGYVAGQRLEYAGNRLDPDGIQVEILIKAAFLPGVRSTCMSPRASFKNAYSGFS